MVMPADSGCEKTWIQHFLLTAQMKQLVSLQDFLFGGNVYLQLELFLLPMGVSEPLRRTVSKEAQL